ncbi:O-antigen ligase family protein [Arenibaculum sp.]|jgi:O-antigen ligase|uniref:O-antigen ligase family protein n=1 Tax=Arenibaculum sp. TaxID=2865862 RepID=UPI002E147E25|nr:O-antigen ligase family protein [Arenibaculum sp.]
MSIFVFYVHAALIGLLFTNFLVYITGADELKIVDDIILLIGGVFVARNAAIGGMTKYLWGYLCLLLASYLASAFSGALSNYYVHGGQILQQFRNIFFPMLGLCIGLQVLDRDSKKISRMFLVASMLISLVAVFEYTISGNFWNIYNKYGQVRGVVFRAHSFIGDPTDFGYFLLFALMPVTFMALNTKGKDKIKFLIFLSFLVIGLLLANSRGPMLTALCGVSAILLSAINRKGAVVAYAAVIAGGLMFYQGVLSDRFAELLSPISYLSAYDPAEWSRQLAYVQSIPVLRDHFFLGTGPGNFGGWVAVESESVIHRLYNIRTFGTSSIDVHYLHRWGELGFVGIIVFIAMLAKIFLRYWHASRLQVLCRDTYGAMLSASVMSLTVCVFVWGFYSMATTALLHMTLYWFMVGLAEARYRAFGHVEARPDEASPLRSPAPLRPVRSRV